jgi:RimJ/RimL family protein N-acetyltransferase
MPAAPTLRTERLILRPWRDQDVAPFAALNADPEVMAEMGGPRHRADSEAAARRIREHFDTHGYGLWAAELPDVESFIGFIGLAIPGFEASFTPCVEIGWRLARAYWGQGYASEGARAALDFGFERLGLEEIVSFTTITNLRSRRVMERIGMIRRAEEDFDHPNLPEGHPLRRHVLYRIGHEQWRGYGDVDG